MDTIIYIMPEALVPKKIKVKNPKNLDLALQYLQSGNFPRAEAICRQILLKHPNHSRTLYLLGKTIYYSGRYDNAIQYISKAIQINPGDSYYHLDLGLALLNKGMTDEAIDSFQNALELKKHSPEICLNLGVAFSHKGLAEKAIAHFRKAVELNPEFAEAFNNLGVVLEKNGLTDEAMASYEKALKIKPDYADAHNNLANVLNKKGMSDEAIEHYSRALEIKPGYADAHNNLALVLKDKGMLDKAIDHYKKALIIKPDYMAARISLCGVLKDKGMIDEAIEQCTHALVARPGYADIYNMLGLLHAEKNMLDEAVKNYDKALGINPDYAGAHRNLSLILLTKGDLKNGWKEYEWRLSKEDTPSKQLPLPVWDGLQLEGKTLFIHAEQGIGDEIMFASCIDDLSASGGTYILECDARLVPLFSRSFPEINVIPHMRAEELNDIHTLSADAMIAIGSLPRFFRPALSSFPQQKSYLVPDKNKVGSWHNRFDAMGKGLKIGISWRGGLTYRIKHTRSISLEQWHGLLSMGDIHFINLQYGECGEELLHIKNKYGITVHDWEDSDPLKDLDDFAAQIAALDLVISVDNSTVHMAGALGVPVWTLLPFTCNWSWMMDFEDTPWYKSVRLFRQATPGDWEGVFERVISALNEYVATGVMPEMKNSYKDSVR